MQFQPGDLLVLYSDGVTEAYNDREEEFGEARLIQVLEAGRNLEISALLTKLLKEVNQFSAGKQSDDVTAISRAEVSFRSCVPKANGDESVFIAHLPTRLAASVKLVYRRLVAVEITKVIKTLFSEPEQRSQSRHRIAFQR